MCAPNPGGLRKDPLSRRMDRDAMKVGGKDPLVRAAHVDSAKRQRTPAATPPPAATGALPNKTLLGI